MWVGVGIIRYKTGRSLKKWVGGGLQLTVGRASGLIAAGRSHRCVILGIVLAHIALCIDRANGAQLC
jgi:hypothetical protein